MCIYILSFAGTPSYWWSSPRWPGHLVRTSATFSRAGKPFPGPIPQWSGNHSDIPNPTRLALAYLGKDSFGSSWNSSWSSTETSASSDDARDLDLTRSEASIWSATTPYYHLLSKPCSNIYLFLVANSLLFPPLESSCKSQGAIYNVA